MSHMNESCHAWLSRVAHAWGMSYIGQPIRHLAYSVVMGRVRESCRMWASHATVHTATHCNTLQHTIQHSATCYVIHCNALHKSLPLTHCDALQHNATHYTIHCSTICNTLQYTSEWSPAHIRVWDRTSRVYNENVFYVAPDTCIVFWSKENTVSSM